MFIICEAYIQSHSHVQARAHTHTHTHTTHTHTHTQECMQTQRYGPKNTQTDTQPNSIIQRLSHSFADHINSNCYSITILIPITGKLTITHHLIMSNDSLMYSPHLGSSAVAILTPSGCGLGMVTLYSKLHGSNNLYIVI